jgi:isoquinoline 1-oxidoreductase alpha subunit
MFQFTLNGSSVSVDVDPETPLLWVIREELNLTGTKFGCGMAQCGACTVIFEGSSVRSCLLPISAVQGKSIQTIEWLETDPVGKKLIDAWDKENVAQCGYCQSGQLMSACALLKANPKPTESDTINHMQGNLCRCGTYPRILKAIELVVNEGI